MNKTTKRVMIIAGEASGDMHGALLVKEMKRKDSSLFFCGIGGKALKESGVKIIFEASKLSVVGITEVFSKIFDIFKALSTARQTILSKKPDLLILIDFPDFNLHIARFAHKHKIPVLYYITPQIWAWRSGRIKKIKKLVDHMAVILPFEDSYYKKQNVAATFVGHPILDNENLCLIGEQDYDFTSKKEICIGLIPGSRHGEIQRHLPVMLEAACQINKSVQNLKFVIPIAPFADKKQIDYICRPYNDLIKLEIETQGALRLFEYCDFAIAVSGTVTLEAAIARVPMIIIYKVSTLSYFLGRLLIRVKYISLVNLIAGQKIVPELIQDDVNALNISQQVINILSDPLKLLKIRSRLKSVKILLGKPGASQNAAQIAIQMIKTSYKINLARLR